MRESAMSSVGDWAAGVAGGAGQRQPEFAPLHHVPMSSTILPMVFVDD
jgi:hypothetical protein